MKYLTHMVRNTKRAAVCIAAALILLIPYKSADAVTYIGAGPKLGFVVAERIGAGLDVGGQMLIGFDLGRFGEIHVYPNIDFWFGHEDLGWWTGRAPYNEPTQVELWVFELTFNFDTRYYFPLPPSLPIAPYAGLGFCPVVTIFEYEPDWWLSYYDPDWWRGYYHYDDTDIGPGFNIFAGLDIPLGSHKFFFEMRGKFGEYYHLMKLIGGLSFTIRQNSY